MPIEIQQDNACVEEADSEITTEYPDEIRFRGLPFLLQGWNTIFKKSPQTVEGAPVYRLEDYVLYGAIHIAPAIIYKRSGIWRMERNDPWIINNFTVTSMSAPSDSPIGEWRIGRVTKSTSWFNVFAK
jgi:hypothetical protein